MSFSVFDKDSTLLPALGKPFPDEALISWLTRVAFDHGLRRSTLIRRLGLRSESVYYWGVERLLARRMLDIMAARTNCTTDELKRTTLLHYENKLFSKSQEGVIPHKWVIKECSDSGNHNTGGTLFCPSCLAKADRPVYFKRQWRLNLSFVCVDCGCYLRETCPHCQMGSFYKNKAVQLPYAKTIDDYLRTCANCNKNISKCKPEPAPDRAIQMQRQINGYLEQDYNQTERHSVGHFNVMDHIARLLVRKTPSLNSFTEAVFRKCNIADPRLDQNVSLLHHFPLKQRAAVFTTASWLLEGWPDRFISLCNQHRLSSAEILKYAAGLPDWFINCVNGGIETAPYQPPKAIPKENYLTIYRVPFDNNQSDYDYDPDEAYFAGEIYDEEVVYNKYRNKDKYCASDIIYEQYLKAEGWA